MGGILKIPKKIKYEEVDEEKAFEKFCENIKFINGQEITVKVDEKFAAKNSANF